MSICRAPGRTSGWPGRRTSCPTPIGRSRTWKAWLLGTHRGVGADHLQVYLDEFVFRWNRRRSPMAGFQTLLGLGTGREPSTYLEILGPQPATGTPRRPSRKTGVTRVVRPLAG